MKHKFSSYMRNGLRGISGTLYSFGALAFLPFWALMINGKTVQTAPIQQSDEVYIPLSALKAAGAQVTMTDGKLSIRFLPVTGGANQIDAIEGDRSEWLFNG